MKIGNITGGMFFLSTIILGGCVFDSMGLGPGDPSINLDFSLESSSNWEGPRPDKPPPDLAIADATSTDGPIKPDLPTWDGHHPDKVVLDSNKADAKTPDAKLVDGPVKPDQKVADAKSVDDMNPDQKIKPDLPKVCTHPKVVQSCTNGWCKIPAGCFTMGSPTSDPCRETAGKETSHQVTLTHNFEISQTEVTQKQFMALMGYNPSSYYTPSSGPNPVERVNWHEATNYCNKLSTAKNKCFNCTGTQSSTNCTVIAAYAGTIYNCLGYRLPTEAEWEYAYRSGTTTSTYIGNLTGCKTDPLATKIAWYGLPFANSKPAKSKQANPWGLYGMAGNIEEWVYDRYQVDLGSNKATNPFGSTSGTSRVTKGGSYGSPSDEVRAAWRRSTNSLLKDKHRGGIRCVRTLP